MSEEKKVVRPVSWPHDAKCAFSLSFDLDGDTIWRNKTVVNTSKDAPSVCSVRIAAPHAFWIFLGIMI